MQEILTKVRQVDELIAEVASASKEQSQGISQVNLAVGQMDKVTQSNAANAEESASAAEQLNAQAESLKDAVGELKSLVDGSAYAESAAKAERGVQAPANLPKASIKQPIRPKLKHNRREAAPAPVSVSAQAGPREDAGLALEGEFKNF